MIREEAIRIPFEYAAGTAASRFLAALRDQGRLLGSRCPACARVAAPARPFCPACGTDSPETVEVGPEGVLSAWTARPDGTVFGLVRLDGADGALVHRVLAAPDDLAPGIRVRARLAPERVGSILDIAGFEPLPEDTP
jgi:uncharacterized OB-fold protein